MSTDVTEVIERGGRKFTQTRPQYKSWRRLRSDRDIDEIILQPNKFIARSELLREHNHKYWPDDPKLKTIEGNTLFWYPPDLYEPPTIGEGKKKIKVLPNEIAGIYLKGVITQDAQDEALKA
jgi:hypothetical protein